MTGAPSRAADREPLVRAATAVPFLVNGFVFASWVPHVPAVQARLDLGYETVGAILSAMPASALAGTLASRPLVARFGSRTVLLVASPLYCALMAMLPFAGDVAVLALWTVACGVLNGAMVVSMNVQGTALENRLGRPVMSSLHAAFSLGAAMGAGLSGLWLAHRLPAFGYAAASALIGAGLSIWAARVRTDEPPGAVGAAPVAAPPRPLALLCALTAFTMAAEGAAGNWADLHLNGLAAPDARIMGAAFATFSLVMALARLLGARAVSAFGAVAVVRAGAALAAIGLVQVALVDGSAGALVGFAFMGAGIANVLPILFSAAGRVPDVAPGTAVASVAMSVYAGMILGPLAVGAVAGALDLSAAMLFLAALMAATAGCAGTVRPAAGVAAGEWRR